MMIWIYSYYDTISYILDKYEVKQGSKYLTKSQTGNMRFTSEEAADKEATRLNSESSQELDEDKMDKEELKQAQIDKAYDHLEKMKENTKLFSKDDIKKAEARIEKLEAELDALADKSTNESLDEFTVRRWQHYAGIK
jgi:polyhydroxyalkanoate synthesis regulator phasin